MKWPVRGDTQGSVSVGCARSGRSDWWWRSSSSLRRTGTTQQGNAFAEADAKDKTLPMLAGLARMLKRYCESGEMLRVTG